MSLLRDIHGLKGDAALSEDGRYRWSLTREWAPNTAYGGGTVVWLMLNPSTADAAKDDPTVRRCIRFSVDWGYNKLFIVNLFPFRSASPKACLEWLNGGFKDVASALVVNRRVLRLHALYAQKHIVAFGRDPLDDEWARVMYRAFDEATHADLYCLGTSSNGMPKHPMARGKHRVPDDFSPVPWRWPK